MANAEASTSEHNRQQLMGLTTLWALALAAGFVILFGLTQWGVLSDVPTGEIGLLAVGTANAVGLIAIGGWNAVGIISIGGANSVGVIAIGGFNSVGIISVGAVNGWGVFAIGGIGGFGIRWRAQIFQWSPLVGRGQRHES